MPTTLLAVDDSVTMRKVLEITFAGEDYRLVTAENVDAALKLARSEKPGIVLLDVTLPEMDGYAVCRSIKQDVPGCAVVLLSSKQSPYDAGRGSAAGADDFMDKPFDTQQMIDKVRKVAAAKAAQPATMEPPPATAKPAAAAPLEPRPGGTLPGAGQAPRASAPLPTKTASFGAPAPAASPRPISAPAPTPTPASGMARPPAQAAPSPVAAAVDGAMGDKLAGLGLTPAQADAVLALSRDLVERVVWEVVPVLAETMIREEIKRLTAEG